MSEEEQIAIIDKLFSLPLVKTLYRTIPAAILTTNPEFKGVLKSTGGLSGVFRFSTKQPTFKELKTGNIIQIIEVVLTNTNGPQSLGIPILGVYRVNAVNRNTSGRLQTLIWTNYEYLGIRERLKTKKGYSATDIFGRKVKIGDYIIIAGKRLNIGVVTGLTPKGIRANTVSVSRCHSDRVESVSIPMSRAQYVIIDSTTMDEFQTRLLVSTITQ